MTSMADDPSTTTNATSTTTTSGPPRPGFRGKCLYKTGKCSNERALKTSGQAHNLCDEHRHRQNEHQRKLDAKNRYARKDRRASARSDSPTSTMAAAAIAATRNLGHRYVPYGKVRMSPTQAGTAGVDDVHAILGRNGIVATSAMTQPMMQFHALGMDGANAMAAAASQLAGGNGNGNGNAVPAGSPEILPSGVVILPNGPQAPQMPYPSAMQDFDGIVVPLPSYLEGHERVEFRSRIYQKVLDFIAEECMRRFGAVGPGGMVAQQQLQPAVINNSVQSTSTPSPSNDRREDESNDTIGATSTAEAMTKAEASGGHGSGTESEESSSEKKVLLSTSQPENEKDGGHISNSAQPEDAEEDDSGDDIEEEEEEEEEAPRSKRPTRVRAGRKEAHEF